VLERYFQQQRPVQGEKQIMSAVDESQPPAVDVVGNTAAVEETPTAADGEVVGAEGTTKPKRRGGVEKKDETPIEELFDLTKPIPKVKKASCFC
jgi:hypothetical protein